MSPGDEHALAVLFRQESGRLVAYLARFFGVRDLATAEDVAQETLLVALQSWRQGLPAEPTAWLFTVAKNRARDVLRRRSVRRGNGEVALDSDELAHEPPEDDADADLLRMMFSCCHPSLTEDTQTALILRLVCGFGTAEVAQAFFSDSLAMEKRLGRAKKVLADDGRLFDVTTREEAHERRAAVMEAIYLMFDAGYHSSIAPEVVRFDVAAEAIRLATLLAESRATTGPAVHALAALTCLHGARLPARFAGGVLVPLEEQDRSAWDGQLLALGMHHLAASAMGGELTVFHLEAGIAAQHATAGSVDTTSWAEVARLYDLLYARKSTPVVALSRAIARARLFGPRNGIAEVLALDGRERLDAYPFYWAALGDLATRAGDVPAARSWLARGLTTARTEGERDMFLRRLRDCGDALS
ncbi:MAG: polymerase sigma-70 factor, subfamily [Labilithrix sp.]|nr:polymerase sigma-70 factor, subfamily [Labilithrix sp.]